MLNTASMKALLESKLTQPHKHDYSSNELNADGKLLQAVEAVLAEEQAIVRDTKTSDEGKREKLRALGERTLSNLEWLPRLRAVNAQNLARVERETFAFLDPPKDESDSRALVRELRASEIRGNYEGAEHNANSGFLQALDKGDLETAQALVHAPGGSLVQDDIRLRGARQYALAHDPEAVKTLDAFRHLQQYFDTTIDALHRWLLSFGLPEKTIRTALKLEQGG